MNFLKKDFHSNKTKLENKLKIAKENTAPVFDLTECNLKTVPPNTFALCRTLKKEALFLQKNHISSFGQNNLMTDLANLKILDISFNRFTKLPPSIEELKKLEVLKMNDNHLQDLPEEIGNLNNLIHLNIAKNNFKSIPLSLGNCISLQVLNLKNNKHLTELPVTLGKLKCLAELEIDPTITFPPAEVCSKGTSATIHFLAQELETNVEESSTKNKLNAVDIAFKNLEDEKRMERLALEQELKSNILKEVEVQNQLKMKKGQLLAAIKNEQDYLANALARVQEQKDVDRELLIKLCQEEENISNDIILKILKNNKKLQSETLAAYSKQMKEDLENLMKKSERLNDKDKKLVLESMNEVVGNEIKKAQDVSAGKNIIMMKSVLAELGRESEALEEAFKKFNISQKDMIKTLKSNETLQKSAVASLIEKNDATSWALKQQIIMIEEKLIELTRLELSKKKLESNQLMTELSHNRIALTKVLLDLFDQQEARRQVLIDTLRQMEVARSGRTAGQNYWLEQYKNILDSRSAEMVKFFNTVDSVLVSKFFEFGVFPFLPILKDFTNDENLKKLNNKILLQLGINSAEDRKNIALAIDTYFAIKKSRQITPSAPPVETEPSAPPSASPKVQHFSFIVPEECVICLDAKPNVIFIPCGHVCCCFKCFSSIALCPICRVPIDTVQKILIPNEE